ncbi:MAG: UDP-N-acetylglucosamine 2-epimerase (non-hydrolyzing) [Chloroflexota bacterium]
MNVVSVVGTRPNFVKLAGLHQAFQTIPDLHHKVVHTGQHYDFKLNAVFFQELKIPEPDYYLEIGSGSHAEQVGNTMIALENLLREEISTVDWILAIGDVNAAISTAMVAKKLNHRLVHVEAGLRSFDWQMPEEINRVVTDRLSDLLLVSDPVGVENLQQEGVEDERIVYVGNVMIDTLRANLHLAEARPILKDLDSQDNPYGVITLHRPSNVDDPHKLHGWLQAFEAVTAHLNLFFVVHPRTQARLSDLGFQPTDPDRLRLIDSLGYLDMLALQKGAKVVLTDSGGIQEETTALGVPCLTLRDNTERPATVDSGTNQLIGSKPEALLEAVTKILNTPASTQVPPLWDGQTGQRIAQCLLNSVNLPLRNQ